MNWNISGYVASSFGSLLLFCGDNIVSRYTEKKHWCSWMVMFQLEPVERQDLLCIAYPSICRIPGIG